jgi:hypothetical protein
MTNSGDSVFYNDLNESEGAVWGEFKAVLTNFPGNIKAEN